MSVDQPVVPTAKVQEIVADATADLREEVATLREEFEATKDELEATQEELTETKQQLDAARNKAGANETQAVSSETRCVSPVEIRGAEDIESANPQDVWIAGHPFGQWIRTNRRRIKRLNKAVLTLAGAEPNGMPVDLDDQDFETLRDTANESENTKQTRIDRSKLLPIHKMVVDLNDEDPTLSKRERRAARLFRRFIRKAAGDPSQNVDAGGQTYSMTTALATDILEAEGELEGVQQHSYSQVVGRVMRDVQRFTIVEECSCRSIDKCEHGVIDFEAGNPHSLSVTKRQFDAAMQNVADAFEDVSIADSDDGKDGSAAREDRVKEEFDRLEKASAP